MNEFRRREDEGNREKITRKIHELNKQIGEDILSALTGNFIKEDFLVTFDREEARAQDNEISLNCKLFAFSFSSFLC